MINVSVCSFMFLDQLGLKSMRLSLSEYILCPHFCCCLCCWWFCCSKRGVHMWETVSILSSLPEEDWLRAGWGGVSPHLWYQYRIYRWGVKCFKATTGAGSWKNSMRPDSWLFQASGPFCAPADTAVISICSSINYSRPFAGLKSKSLLKYFTCWALEHDLW